MIFIKNLTNIDFAYLKKGDLYGETLLVDVTVYGKKNKNGWLIDFGILKKRLKKILSKIDHKLLTTKNIHLKKSFLFRFDYKLKDLSYYINSSLKKDKNIRKIQINLRKEKGPFYFFNYTHGLKTHRGGCSNLVHGHANKFEIYKKGKRFLKAERWLYLKYLKKSPYIAAKEYLLEQTKDSYKIGYSGNWIELKKDKVIFLNDYPTIENITEFFAQETKKKFGKLKIIFYEGINKGCIL